MKCISKEIFPNPRLAKTTNSGNTYYTFDKGYMICEIEYMDKTIRVLTHQGFPFRRFNSTPESNPKVFDFFDEQILKYNPDVITGDFNAEDFMALMPNTKKEYIRTINDVTTVDNMKFDDILVKKDANYSTGIVKLLSDHYAVINDID